MPVMNSPAVHRHTVAAKNLLETLPAIEGSLFLFLPFGLKDLKDLKKSIESRLSRKFPMILEIF